MWQALWDQLTLEASIFLFRSFAPHNLNRKLLSFSLSRIKLILHTRQQHFQGHRVVARKSREVQEHYSYSRHRALICTQRFTYTWKKPSKSKKSCAHVTWEVFSARKGSPFNEFASTIVIPLQLERIRFAVVVHNGTGSPNEPFGLYKVISWTSSDSFLASFFCLAKDIQVNDYYEPTTATFLWNNKVPELQLTIRWWLSTMHKHQSRNNEYDFHDILNL